VRHFWVGKNAKALFWLVHDVLDFLLGRLRSECLDVYTSSLILKWAINIDWNLDVSLASWDNL
jgi:hypothetical protein